MLALPDRAPEPAHPDSPAGWVGPEWVAEMARMGYASGTEIRKLLRNPCPLQMLGGAKGKPPVNYLFGAKPNSGFSDRQIHLLSKRKRTHTGPLVQSTKIILLTSSSQNQWGDVLLPAVGGQGVPEGLIPVLPAVPLLLVVLPEAEDPGVLADGLLDPFAEPGRVPQLLGVVEDDAPGFAVELPGAPGVTVFGVVEFGVLVFGAVVLGLAVLGVVPGVVVPGVDCGVPDGVVLCGVAVPEAVPDCGVAVPAGDVGVPAG